MRFRIIEKVSSKWELLGDLTEQSDRLDNYKAMTMNNHFECCRFVFQHWIDSTPKEVTWDCLYELLDDAQFSEVSSKIRRILEYVLRN